MFEEYFDEPVYYQHADRELVIIPARRVYMSRPEEGYYIRYFAVVVDKQFCASASTREKLSRNEQFMMYEPRFKKDFREAGVVARRSVATMGANNPFSVGSFVFVERDGVLYRQWPTKGGWLEYFDEEGGYPNTYLASLGNGNSAKGMVTIGSPSLPKKKSAREEDAWVSRVQAVVGNLDL